MMRQQTSSRSLIFLFVGYFCVWVAANWPALHSPWWHTDDFARANVFDVAHSLQQGRPVEALVASLLWIEHANGGGWWNPGFRLLQVAFHAGNAVLIALAFQPIVKRRLALAAALFFLLWPFQGEAVLWRAAMSYPVAACVSLGGFHLLRKQRFAVRLLGAGLILIAVLTNQLAALAAIVVWVNVQAFYLLQQNRLAPRLRQEGILLAAAYSGGALISLLFIRTMLAAAGRAALPTSFADKVHFWLELNRQYLASPNYPPFLTILQIALVGAALLAVAIAWWRKRITFGQAGAAIGLLALLSCLPYTTVFLVAESAPAWRILYLAPFVSMGAWLILQQLLSESRPVQITLGAVLALFLLIYVPMNVWNAADYVTVFNADRATLHTIETFAAAQQPAIQQVVVATFPHYRRAWDLYGVNYMHYDSKQSAFLRDWSAIAFIAWFSRLSPMPAADNPWQQAGEPVQQCVDLCWLDQEQQPWQLIPMGDQPILCVCP